MHSKGKNDRLWRRVNLDLISDSNMGHFGFICFEMVSGDEIKCLFFIFLE